jgi:hypothetical protein
MGDNGGEVSPTRGAAAPPYPRRADDFCQMVRMERMVPFTDLLLREMLDP